MILIGTKCQLEQTVTEDLTAAKIGSGLLPVFGTPFMAAMMENAAQTALQNFLDDDKGSVGTHLDISHDAPTPVGMKVWVEAVKWWTSRCPPGTKKVPSAPAPIPGPSSLLTAS